MLFNSHEFVFLFLPATAAVFFLLGGSGCRRFAISWLIAASVFFYGYWNPAYLPLLLGSVLVNYFIGTALTSHKRRWLLTAGIVLNLGVLGYFKYANFFIENLSFLSLSHIHVVLPIAISFLTFEQVAYLVDTYRGRAPRSDFLRYCLFVTFFPRLIAGPIVRAQEILPQFDRLSFVTFSTTQVASGLTIFVIGLFKKVIFADHVASYATEVFQTAEEGGALTFWDAWGGVLAFTVQIYFDFSGYSDMAIGLARMFGISLPLNFNSPYKAGNIIDFWRRWHMTLSRFLRDYLYISLGGDRKGKARQYVNLMITMLLAGLWHGAGWTFVAWGALHGFYLIINHAWRSARSAFGHDPINSTWWGRATARMVTLIAVVLAWTLFRAESFTGAMNVLTGMTGANGAGGISTSLLGYLIAPMLLLVCCVAPNSQELVDRVGDASMERLGKVRRDYAIALCWKPNLRWAVAVGLMFYVALVALTKNSEFVYFQF
jgi:alginate O-acetyltransferase complex protein AlgI